jgi:hypothetical protein
MGNRYSQVSGVREAKKQKMANNGNGIKPLYYILSLVITVAMSVGSIVAVYFKSKIESEIKINTLMMQIAVMEENLGNRIDWTSQSIEILAREVPRAIEKHEYKMHKTEAMSPSSPTKIAIELPKKPSKGN